MKLITEPIVSQFDGTIIDLETTGDFSKQYKHPEYSDSREYSNIKPVFFGFMTSRGIEIHCAESKSEINELLSTIVKLVPNLPKPFHSFNTPFETGVLFHSTGEKILFERELNKERYEAKRLAVEVLKLQNYDDPFLDNGKMFPPAWEKGNMKDCIAHNRADLFKERDILLKRGFRTPDEFRFIAM
ncbi:MAG: hypothetical protein WC613_03245 [Candidatus Aenigmatarchaeota archaeon]